MEKDNFGLPEGVPSPDQVDVMAQRVVPQLYKPSDPRVLDPNAEVLYDDCRVKVLNVAKALRVVTMAPCGISSENARGILSFESGYMMPPTSPLGDQFARPLARRLRETDSMAIFWAPYARGTDEPWEEIGNMPAEEVQDWAAKSIRVILRKFDPEGIMQHWLAGHSKGGQSASNLFNNPKRYGFRREGDFNGLYAVCPVPLPHSQVMLYNRKAWTQLIPGGLWPVIVSLVTGKGVVLNDKKGRKFFVGNDKLIGIEEVLKRLFPDSAKYFVQTLTTGSSAPVGRSLHNSPVAVLHAYDDRIVNAYSAHAYRRAMNIVPEGTVEDERMARQSWSASIKGDHMAPFYMNAGEDGDPPARVAQIHYWLLSQVINLG